MNEKTKKKGEMTTFKKIMSVILVIAIIVAFVDIGIVFNNIRTEREYLSTVSAKVNDDVTSYVSQYELAGSDVSLTKSLVESGATKEIAESATEYLVKNNANISALSSSVNGVITKNITGIDEQQLKILTTGIEAICISDVYKTISDRNLVDTAGLNKLASGIDTRLSVLEASMQAHSDGLDAQLSDMQSRVNDMCTSDATSIINMSNDLTAMLAELRSLEAEVNESGVSEELEAKIQSLVKEMEQSDNSTITSIAETLRKVTGTSATYESLDQALSSAISILVAKSLEDGHTINSLSNEFDTHKASYNNQVAITKAEIKNTNLLLDTINTDLTDTINQNKSDTDTALNNLSDDVNSTIAQNKTATDNAISSLNGVVTQNKTDTEAALDALEDTINNNIGTAVSELTTSVNAVSANLDAQQSTLQGLIDTANTNYTDYVAAVEHAQEVAEAAIASDLGSAAGGTGALGNIERDRLSALQDIANDLGTKTTSGARFDIESDRVGALSDIETAKNNSTSAVSAQEASSIAAVKQVQDTYDDALASKEATVRSQTETLAATSDTINGRLDSLESGLGSVEDDIAEAGYLKANWVTEGGTQKVILAPPSTP